MKTVKSLKKAKSAWVIRAGESGSAGSYFLDNNVVSLNDSGIGDLAKLKPNREAFYLAYKLLKPEESNTTIAGVGGKYFRFVHDMKIDDMVIYPSLIDMQVYVGIVTSNYQFNKNNATLPHQREVVWITSFPKSVLSQGAKYELNAARTFFEYKKHLDDIFTEINKSQPLNKKK